MDITLIILYGIIFCLHSVALLLNLTIVVIDESASIVKRGMSALVSLTLLAWTTSDIVVILLLFDVINENYRNAVIMLDVIAAFMYIFIFTNASGIRSSTALKGVASDESALMSKHTLIKFSCEVVAGYLGIVMISSSTKYYVHYFLSLHFYITNILGYFVMRTYQRGLVRAGVIHPELSAPQTIENDGNSIKYENAKTEIRQSVRTILVIIFLYSTMTLPLLVLFNDGSFTSSLIVILPQKFLLTMGTIRLAIAHKVAKTRESIPTSIIVSRTANYQA